ncbi:MAG: hypothetical protein SPF38_02340 [Dysosmobacter sp.]|nr:hypothetical protein [Dysosmobacter sp.]
MTRKKPRDIVGKYFWNALGGGLRREPQGDNRTDERHRGSQLKVPKETGIFSRKNGPAVIFYFHLRATLSAMRVQILFQVKLLSEMYEKVR